MAPLAFTDMDRNPASPLLIDADNASAEKIELILGELDAAATPASAGPMGTGPSPG